MRSGRTPGSGFRHFTEGFAVQFIKTIAPSAGVLFLAASTASASIVVSTSEGVWRARANAAGKAVVTEDFNSYEGYYASPLSGTTGPVNWTATASNGLFAHAGVFSTNSPEPLTFNFDPAVVRGVAGNIFATYIDFTVAPALVDITLGDGTTYEGEISSSSAFTGFWSTGAGIASISIDAMDLGGTAVFPSVDRMLFAVNGSPSPAPGALALLGAVGLIGARRRRD
jgi:MYXO-CTERM domain-containing protein